MSDPIPPSSSLPSAGSTLPTQHRNATDLTTASQLDGGSLSDSPSPAPIFGEPTSAPFPTIPGYTLISRLGSGGTSEVYEALDGIGNRFALKRPRERSISTPGLERFEREARAMSALDHPNVAPLCYWGCHQFVPYYTMPIYPGGSMADRLGYYRDNLREAVALLADVADALYHVHSKRLLHRDLKPHNILLDAEGKPAIADFGLVREIDGSTATVTTARLGTPAYMSPEQARGEHRTLTPQTDIWSFGVILYEVLTGQRPFAGEDADTVIVGILTLPVPHPTTVLAGADRGLCRIVGNCLQKDPKGRYTCASQLRDDLRRWLDGSKVPSRRVSRQFRRYRLPAVSFAAVMVLAVLLMPGVVGGDPQAEADPTMEILNRGETAVVVGDTGPPRLPIAILEGMDVHKTNLSPDGFAAWCSNNLLLLRVGSKPTIPQWEFRAEMRLSDQQLSCTSGIFFGYKQIRSVAAASRFLKFTWCDPLNRHQLNSTDRGILNGTLPGTWKRDAVPVEEMIESKSDWYLDLMTRTPTGNSASFGLVEETPMKFQNSPRPNVHQKWRSIRLTVLHQRVELYFDGVLLRRLDRPYPVKINPARIAAILGSNLIDPVDGEMGFYFRLCTLEVRNVQIASLRE